MAATSESKSTQQDKKSAQSERAHCFHGSLCIHIHTHTHTHTHTHIYIYEPKDRQCDRQSDNGITVTHALGHRMYII